LPLAVLGDHGEPGRDSLGRRARRAAAVWIFDVAAVERVGAKDCPGDLAAAGADQPGERDDLALVHCKRYSIEDAVAAQVMDGEQPVAA
jgi:hypothetical protein